MSGTKKIKHSCSLNKDIIVWERWEMGEENERKNEKSVMIMWVRKEKQNWRAFLIASLK
jgi:hypothetical protein